MSFVSHVCLDGKGALRGMSAEVLECDFIESTTSLKLIQEAKLKISYYQD